MAKLNNATGFGFNSNESQHHFLIFIPKLQKNKVLIYERFEWDENDNIDTDVQKIDARFDRLKVEMPAIKWKMIQEALQKEFNQRLKKMGHKVNRFKQGPNIVQRLFGKEMVLLVWAIEDSDPKVIPDAIKNWLGLKPEERWWLYTMTNASTGEANTKYGWRKAIRYALCENPVNEKHKQTNLFDQYISDQIEGYNKKNDK